jgi:hypothetical protein
MNPAASVWSYADAPSSMVAIFGSLQAFRAFATSDDDVAFEKTA